MKKTLILLAALLAFAACKPVEVEVIKEVEVEKIVDILSLNAAQLRVPNSAVEQPLSFTTTDAWTISSDVDWITFDKTSGNSGSSNVTMKVAANSAYDTRTGRVTLSTSRDGTAKNTVFTVVQSETEVFNTAVECRVDYTEQDIAVDFNSNLTPEVAIVEGAEWLTITQTKAAPVDGKIVVHVALNEELDSRVGSFTVAAGSSIHTYNVMQASQYAAASSATALFLGNAQDMYDSSIGWKTFAQYAVQFTTSEGDVTLVLNVDPEAESFTKVPAGEYKMDETGEYAPGTYSIQSGKGSYITTVVTNGKAMEVVDGTITVEDKGSSTAIVAEFVDVAGTSHLYSYTGELVAADASFGVNVNDANYRGQYYTYFASKAHESILGLQFNKPFPGVERYISYMSFSIYSEANDGYLPTGTFTYAVPENDPSLSYKNGTLAAAPGTFNMTSCQNRMESWGEANYTMKEGTNTLEIIKQDDGRYTLKFNMTVIRTTGEEENAVSEEIPLVATIADINCGPLTDMGMVVVPDAEEFVIVNGGMNPMTQGQYYGDKFDDGGHLATFGWGTVNDGSLSLNLLFNFGSEALTPTAGTISAKYQDELGATPRYYRGAIPDGTYTYSETYDKDAKQLLHGFYGKSARGYIQNTYTGTVFHVVGGSITFSQGTPTFDLQAVSASGKTAHFTGSFVPTSTNLDFNYQHSSYRNSLTISTLFALPD